MNAETTTPLNHHPSVMFEIMAKDQPKLQEFYQSAFHWSYTMGKDGFAYVSLKGQAKNMMSGIPNSKIHVGPSFEYLRVNS
jgi:uncharacterized protein